MEQFSHRHLTISCRECGRALVIVALVLALAAGWWIWRAQSETPAAKGPQIVPVVSAVVATGDIPVRLSANGTAAWMHARRSGPPACCVFARS